MIVVLLFNPYLWGEQQFIRFPRVFELGSLIPRSEPLTITPPGNDSKIKMKYYEEKVPSTKKERNKKIEIFNNALFIIGIIL